MKTRFARHLSILLVLALLAALFCAPAMAAEEDEIRLAFTSDVHYDSNYAQNNLEVWLSNMEGSFDVLAMCGDMGSAYAANGPQYWGYVQQVIDYVDGQIAAGKIGQSAYTLGNHEWYPYAGGDYANFKDDPTAQRLLYIGEAIKTDDYIVYCFGAGAISAAFGQGYDLADIATMDAYLADAPTDVPIFVLTHFPTHDFGGRTTENSAALVETLNKYPNVVLLWGHNHSVFDTYYDTIYKPGASLVIDAAGTEAEINFTYAAAGCMSDAEYTGPDGGSAFIRGKALVATIKGGEVDFTYYNMAGEAQPKQTSDGPFSVFFRDGLTNQFFDEQHVAKGAAAVEPALPDHPGYEFTGWSYAFDKVENNMIVDAYFEEIKLPTNPEATEPGYVYVTLEVDGAQVEGKSGKILANYPIPYTAGMTIGDAFVKLHELEYVDGTAGVVCADSGYGFANFTKLWGMDGAYGSLAFTGGNYVDANAAAKEGGAYYALAYTSIWKSTSYTTPGRTRAHVGQEISLRAVTMPMNADYTYSAKGLAGDLLVGSSLADLKDTGIDVDGTGYFKYSFQTPGKYILYIKDNSGAAGDAVAEVEVYKSVVQPSNQGVTVDGAAIVADVYNIDGSNYFKLRDIAYALNGTAAQFSVGYDKESRTITAVSGEAYEAVGGEMAVGEDKSATAVISNQSIIINGKSAQLTAFNIGGSNYFKLRDLADALGFFVDYDAETRTALILTTDPKDAMEAAGTVYCYAVVDANICEDGNGKPIAYYPVSYYEGETIADVVTRLHEDAYGDKDGWGYEGLLLSKLWGQDCGSMSYGGGVWTEESFAGALHADPTAPVEDGMIVYLNNFTDGVGYAHFRCGYFDKVYAELNAGDSLTLTFHRSSGDGSSKLNGSSEVFVDGAKAGSTDANGAITLSFDAPGTYLVTGAAGNSWGTGICVVVVK